MKKDPLPILLPIKSSKESEFDDDLPDLIEIPERDMPGGTRRKRQYKHKTKRYRTLSKRFKKNKTRRLHRSYIR